MRIAFDMALLEKAYSAATLHELSLIKCLELRCNAVFGGQDTHDIVMLLIVCNRNTPLHFNALLRSHVDDFLHDISGIVHNVDPETGALGNGFIPKCAKKNLEVRP